MLFISLQHATEGNSTLKKVNNEYFGGTFINNAVFNQECTVINKIVMAGDSINMDTSYIMQGYLHYINLLPFKLAWYDIYYILKINCEIKQSLDNIICMIG